MGDVPKLTLINQLTFFDSLKRGDVFTYSEAFYAEDVIEMAAKEGIEVQYCRPDTRLYRKYGCFTCRVVKSPNDPPGKSTEDKLIDGIMAVSDIVSTGEPISIFEVATTMLNHLGDDAKSITFKGEKKVKINEM